MSYTICIKLWHGQTQIKEFVIATNKPNWKPIIKILDPNKEAYMVLLQILLVSKNWENAHDDNEPIEKSQPNCVEE